MSRPTTTLAAVTNAAPATRSQDPVVSALTNAMGKMKNVLPAHITPERMARIALNELRTNDKLAKAAKANPASFVASVMLASQLGLEIGGAKGHGYLVPYGSEVKFMPGYRGLIALARNSGQVTSISVHIVYSNDEFDMQLGLVETIKHKPLLTGERGTRTLVYGVAHFTDGSHHFDWMSMADVDHVKKSSQGGGRSGPWADHTDEMIRKTMVRRLAKYLPLTADRFDAAVKVADAVDTGNDVTIDGDFTVVEEERTAISDGTGRPAPAGPNVTFAKVQHGINQAATLDELNDAVALIGSVADEQQQGELREAAESKRGTLGVD